MEMDNKDRNFWDKQAPRYDAAEKQFDPVYRDILAKTKKYLGPDDRVLDFGCATGTKAMELAGVAGHVHGLDISAEMIGLAVKRKNHPLSMIFGLQCTVYSFRFFSFANNKK